MDDIDKPKKRRGRPPGSKNRVDVPPPAPLPRAVPPGYDPMDDYRAPDPLTMVARNYAMLDWAQQALRVQMKIGLGAKEGLRVSEENVAELVSISNGLERTMNAHKKAMDLADSLSKNKTPKELLDIAVAKIKGQDLPTLQAIIKDLRKHREQLAPVNKREANLMDGTAAQAIAALEAE